MQLVEEVHEHEKSNEETKQNKRNTNTMVGESRTDLLNWINDTLDLNYTKVEQCGTGAVYCQLVDSIYEDVAMNKVNFDSKNEYEHLNNMKVLQLAFNKHGITKKIQVEKLVKCRLQDNLELLQWFKKYWSDNKNFNAEYDPVARRKAKKAVASRASSGNGMQPPGMGHYGINGSNSNSASATRASSGSRLGGGTRTPSRTGSRVSSGTTTNGTSVGTRTPSGPISRAKPNSTMGTGGRRSASSPVNGGNDNSVTTSNVNANNKLNQLNSELGDYLEQIKSLNKENDDYKISLGALETERNFYYNKLRQIEVFTNNKLDELNANDDVSMNEMSNDDTAKNDKINPTFTKIDIILLLNQINEYLYATSEGFQENDEEDIEVEFNNHNIDEESF